MFGRAVAAATAVLVISKIWPGTVTLQSKTNSADKMLFSSSMAALLAEERR
jgi:hypothetical protein